MLRKKSDVTEIQKHVVTPSIGRDLENLLKYLPFYTLMRKNTSIVIT